jgi:hypothetical protein
MTKIIAFAGRKQSGKTTCANFVGSMFEQMYKKPSKIYNFADPLKRDICINILGLTEDQCYGDDNAKNSKTHIIWENKLLTAREVMQFVGTDLFRKLYNTVWVDATVKKILREKPDLALIADCRFPNEVESIQKIGGLVIKLNRNPFNSDHPSETALDECNYSASNFDFIINNHNMSIDEQNETVVKFLKNKNIL